MAVEAPTHSPHALTAYSPDGGAGASAVPDVATAAVGLSAMDEEAWSQLWFTLERHGWGSLALVPAAPGMSTRALAACLARAARAYEAIPIDVIDAEHAVPEDVQSIIATVASRAAAGARVLITLPSPLVRSPAIPLARTADAALLVVPLEQSAVSEARRTVAAIGGPHFVGSVTVRAR